MKVTNEQIIQVARRQRDTINNNINVAPWQRPKRHRSGLAAVIAVAACLVGFIIGYCLNNNGKQPEPQSVAHNSQVIHDTITQTETIHDTIYDTRIVTKYVTPLMAKSASKSTTQSSTHESQEEQAPCAMSCDDIPYDLLAMP